MTENNALDNAVFNKGKILIVDDNPKNLRFLSEMLTAQGYDVHQAISGEVALNYLQSNQPDLVLLDICMPGMNGYDVCKQLKASEKNSRTPVIFISALTDTQVKVKAFEAGGLDYVTKPFQFEEVLARVNTQISMSRMQKKLTDHNIHLKGEIERRKKAELSLQKAYDDIEIKVEQRTAELKKANETLEIEVSERQKAEKNLQAAMKELEGIKERLEEENVYLQEEIKLTHNFEEIISKNKKFIKVLKEIEQVASSETTVLILGETGTGKELLARAIHNLSDRKNRPLVKVNCAALPSNLIESELFGHEKGAFTGAISRKIGRFELADNGTIFLDEIGDLPIDLQAKMLRVLQEGEFERLGGTQTLKVNTRVIAATNRDLDDLRSKNLFRDDLFFRLNVFPIVSLPLRDRKDDIPLLVSHFLEKFNRKIGKNIDKIPQKALKVLKTYSWPGNVRELENVIERAVIQSQGNQLVLGDWFTSIVKSRSSSTTPTLDEVQKEHILNVLELTDGQISGDGGAAKILGLKPTTLEARMKKLGITSKKKFFA